MYCGQCGKEIPDNAGFCPYCGNKTGNIVRGKNNRTPLNLSDTQQMAGGISVIIWIVLSFAFFIICFLYYGSNMDAFDWVSDSTKMVGVIFYFLIAVLALLDCLMASKKFMEGKQDRKALIANGASTLLYAFVLQIGSWICDDWSDGDMSIVLYRIFGTYKRMVIPLVLAAVVFFGLAAVAERKNNK
jgi:hypothetical protein